MIDRKPVTNSTILFEDKIKLTLSAAKIGIWEWHHDTHTLIWSKEVEEIFGFTEGVEKSFFDFFNHIHAADKEIVFKRVNYSLREKTNLDIEYRLILPHGAIKWINLKGTYHQADHFDAEIMIGMASEITDRKVVEENLEENEYKYRTIIEQTGQIVYDYYLNTGQIVWSGAIEKITGYSNEEFQAVDIHTWESFIHPDHRAEAVKALETSIELGMQMSITYKFRHKNGHYIYIQDNGICLTDGTGTSTRMLGTLQDVTSRHESEEALKNIAFGVSSSTGEKFLTHLVSFLNDTLKTDYIYIGALTKDKKGIETIAFMRKGKLRTNISYALNNTPCENLLNDQLKYYPSNIKDQFPDNEIFNELNIQSYLGVPLFSSSKTPLGILVAMHTDELPNPSIAKYIIQVFASRASAELERLNSEKDRNFLIERLLKQNKELQHFSYILSHTVRSPVATLLGLTSIFDRTDLSNSFNKEVIDNICNVTSKLDEIIKDLNQALVLDKLVDEVKETVNIADSIQAVMLDLEELISDTKAEIVLDIHACCLNTVGKYFRSIIKELLINALKYRSDKNPHIIICSWKNDGNVHLSISDNGLGIDLTRYEDQLFGMYKKFHSISEGKGLGLFQIKNMLNLLNGKIGIKSKHNEGTEVTIMFQQ